MKKLLLPILICFSIATFAQKSKINKGETWYHIFTGKSLEIKTDNQKNFSAQVIDGNDLVFEYGMRADENPDLTDDEYTEKILFSVPKNAKSFMYTDTTLKAAFLRGCFCIDRGWHNVNTGFIKGKKINATTWQVEIDVMTQPNIERNFRPIAKKFKAVFKVYKPSAKNK
ncbi:MAG: hypothetical protein WCO54_02115 [Bacteroidota bacterium]